MAITQFKFILLLYFFELSTKAYVTSHSRWNYTRKKIIPELVTTELITTEPAKRISDRVCNMYKNEFRLRIKVILGGEDAEPGSMPHMGAIGWRSKLGGLGSQWVFKCAGSLISARFLVTAAHCSWIPIRTHFDVVRNEPEIVRLGVEDIESENFEKTPTDKNIKRIIKHPNYKAPKKYFDVALIELEDDVTFSSTLHPACLWTEPGVYDKNYKLILSGWGLTEDGKPSPHLQVAYVDNLSTDLCDELLMRFRDRNWQGFADHQMCAGQLAGNVDTCQGDSGSPIQQSIPFQSLYYIIGVTSFGAGCGKENQPGVYTRMYNILDWIEENVWKDGY